MPYPPATPAAPRPAVFLDRDGTLVQEVPYLHDPADQSLWLVPDRPMAR